MPDVQAAARVGQHLEYVVLGPRGIRGLVQIRVVIPALVPLQLDLVVVVARWVLGVFHNVLRVSRSFLSQPSSIGVSRIKALERSRGCCRMRRNPSNPIYPLPIF